jgi:hypothetical protein
MPAVAKEVKSLRACVAERFAIARIAVSRTTSFANDLFHRVHGQSLISYSRSRKIENLIIKIEVILRRLINRYTLNQSYAQVYIIEMIAQSDSAAIAHNPLVAIKPSGYEEG